jgi:arsenite-transporting ATPase
MRRETLTEEDEILNELQYIKHRISTSARILTDRDRTAFFFVVIPEEMAILDTKKAADLFSKFDVPISGYVVNRVVPQSLLDRQIPDYLRNRIAMQRGYLDEINRSFGAQVLAQVPEMERDVTGLAMIEELAHTMYGE